MTKNASLFVLGALLVLTGGAVSASTITVNCPVVGPLPTELSVNVVCAQYNGVGLTSVQIGVTGTITGTITLTNNSSSSQIVNATTTSQFNVGALPGFTISNPIFTASYGTGNQILTPGQTATFAGMSGSGGAILGPESSNLVFYTGAGTFNIPVNTLTGLTVLGGGGQIGSGQDTHARAAATVTYTYETGEIPEPGTISLLGAGLCALGLAARRLRG